MGAWGSGPYDNDSAADILGGPVADAITPIIERLLDEGEYGVHVFDLRTAVWLMERLWVSPYTRPDNDIAESLMKRALNMLDQAIENDSSEEWQQAMQTQRDNLLSVLRGDQAEPGLMDRIAEHLGSAS